GSTARATRPRMLPPSTPLASALCCGRTSKFAGQTWNAPATLNPSQQQRLARRFDNSLPAFQSVAVEARTHTRATVFHPSWWGAVFFNQTRFASLKIDPEPTLCKLPSIGCRDVQDIPAATWYPCRRSPACSRRRVVACEGEPETAFWPAR